MSRLAPRRARRVLLTLVCVPVMVPACLPYTVGSTAQTVPPGEFRQAATMYVISNAIAIDGDSLSQSQPGIDAEARMGLTETTDLGARFPSGSGIVLTAKRRVWGRADPEAAAVAVMGGLGFVNLGSHAHFELSLLASGATRKRVTPYGGLRAMQVAPMSRGAVHDSPTAGGFIGLRIGDDTLGVSPELGVFYDRSALGLRKNNVIYVPAITLHGERLIRLLGMALELAAHRR